MYGRSFRTFPIERVLADLDEIYFKCKTRWAFVVDDNLVLDPERVMKLCHAVIGRKYRRLNLVVQADCVSISRNEEMVRKMSQAGMKTMFLGIENASKKNLAEAGKGNIVEASRKAVEMCHKYGIMVVAGLISGFPDDDEAAIIENYAFLKSIDADSAFCQILTPYPKTVMRQHLLDQGLVTNAHDYKWYNGMWANVKTRHLDPDRLQYLFWYHRQKVLGWWEPPERVRSQGRLWTSIWIYVFRPMLKVLINRSIRKYGWRGRYDREIKRLARVNAFPDLEGL
jgi:radical SAM superfamily enzyme YgiQ (UPF0313 family)